VFVSEDDCELEAAIGTQACLFEASMRVTNSSGAHYPYVATIHCVETLKADAAADAQARAQQQSLVESFGAAMAQSRGKCGRCGMAVLADQSRSKDKKTGIYYHETCPVKRKNTRTTLPGLIHLYLTSQ
jgi:hypothetical protein